MIKFITIRRDISNIRLKEIEATIAIFRLSPESSNLETVKF